MNYFDIDHLNKTPNARDISVLEIGKSFLPIVLSLFSKQLTLLAKYKINVLMQNTKCDWLTEQVKFQFRIWCITHLSETEN